MMHNLTLSDNTSMNLGSLKYNPSFQLLCSQNNTITLRCKLNKVLNHLAYNRNRLVSRQELIEQVWGGNFYIGEKALTHTVCKLDEP